MKRKVVVHIYKSINRPDGEVAETCDMLIYDTIIPKKDHLIKMGEKALKRVSIDYFLFRKMHEPEDVTAVAPNPEDSVEFDNVNLILKTERLPKTSCPKSRRPFGKNNEECRDGFVMKLNKQQDPCCYKVRASAAPKAKAKAQKICPYGKDPVDGKCQDGYMLKMHHTGVPCCIKTKM